MGDAFSYPLGNFDNAGLSLNGGAAISGASYSNQLQLADGGTGESRSAFTVQQFNVSAFATNFNVQFSGPSTSGFAFVLQGSGDNAVGGGNAGSDGIAKSVAVEFLATTSGTETELNVNGVATTPTLLTPSSLDLSSGQVLLVSMEYDGSTLKVTETETQTTLTPVTSTQTYTNVKISSATGGQAYLGFTGSDGSSGVTQVIQSWEFADSSPTNTDIGSPAAGSSSYTVGGQYIVHGAGTGAGSTSDQLHFVSEPITGDTTTIAQLSAPPSGAAAAGLMLREDTTGGAAFAEVDMTARGVQFISRSSAAAADSVSATIAASGAQWLELVRDGPTVSGYISSSASGSWTLVGTAPVTGSTNALMGLAVSSGSSTTLATANFSGVSVTPTASIGLDTGNVTPSTYQPIWVDIIKQSGGFENVSNNDLAPTNADGWPTTDFRIPSLFTSVAADAGVYSLVMAVSQNPTVSFGGATLSNASYNSSTHIYTASVTIGAGANVSMTVTNTGGGVTNLQIISPGYSTTNPPVFTTGYIDFLQSLHPTVLRFMNFTQTNNNPVMTWAERPMPDDATQTETETLYNYNGTVGETGNAIGVAWEYAIILANAVHADMWINIPAQANDNYVEQLASLIKNGDTINGVVYPALDPDLNVYIEYANETWNPGDEVYQYATDAAVAEVVADAQSGTPSNLNYDNLSLAQNSDGTYVNAPTWQSRWTARRLMQIGNDFAAVFGQAAINTRIRPVLSNIPIPSVFAGQLTYINAVFGAPSKFFYAVAAATYANMDGPGNTTNTINGGNNNPNLSASDVLTDLSANGYGATSFYVSFDALAQQYGLQMDAYESGPDMSGFQDTSTSKIQAELEPQFATFLEQYYEAWYAYGGGTIIYYTGAVRPWGDKYGDFQIADTQTDLFDAKEIGFRAVAGAARPALVPAGLTSLSAAVVSSTQVNLSWGSASATATEYRVEASTNKSFSANLISQIAPAGSTSWSFTGLSPGIAYYFQVIATSAAGDATPSSAATATTSAAAAIPAVPIDVSATEVSSSQVNVTWADSSLIENGFTVTVAIDPGFTQVVQTLTAAADATTLPIYDLNGLTTYYIEVSAFNSAGTSAAANAQAVVTPLPAPLAEYQFNESSGSTVLDSGSGTPANGTIVGGVTRIAGPYNGSALAFNGTTGYVSLGTPAKLNLEGQITVGAWIKPTAVTSQADIVNQDWDGLDYPLFLDLTNASTVNFGTYRYLGNGNTSVQATGTSSAPLTDGNWHYIAGVYDGQDFKVYIDGVLVGETADPYGVTYGTEPTDIGRDSNDGGGSWDYFDGDIADVEIFSNGLSNADIAKLSSEPLQDTWTGAASTAWSNSSNWSAAATPGGFTNVTINSGTVVASSAISVAALALNGGTLQLGSSSGASTVSSLTIAGNGVLNLNNNHLIIDYAGGSDPISAIAGYLKHGYNGGAWNDTGIDSSAAAANTTYGIGYADGADGVVSGLFSGQIEVKYTLNGDANLDGVVNSIDFGTIAADFGKQVSGWDLGDFNYDGVVNSIDFGDLAVNFGKSASSASVALPTVTLLAATTPAPSATEAAKRRQLPMAHR
jgi:hypothetical protein